MSGTFRLSSKKWHANKQLFLAQKIVGSALNAFMGNTEVGQHKEEKYFIYMQHNAVVRLDVLVCCVQSRQWL